MVCWVKMCLRQLDSRVDLLRRCTNVHKVRFRDPVCKIDAILSKCVVRALHCRIHILCYLLVLLFTTHISVLLGFSFVMILFSIITMIYYLHFVGSVQQIRLKRELGQLKKIKDCYFTIVSIDVLLILPLLLQCLLI